MFPVEPCHCGCQKADHSVEGLDSNGCVVTLGWCNRCFCQGYQAVGPRPVLRLIQGGRTGAVQARFAGVPVVPPKTILGVPKGGI